jgi:hypothetical protein
MNRHPIDALAPDDPAQVASACLTHLECEESFLNATLSVLGELRSALVRNDLTLLQEALAKQSRMASEAEALQGERGRLRDRMAGVLGVPAEQARARMLAARLPAELAGLAERLNFRRERLRRLAEEVEEFNHVNAGVVRRCLDFQRRLLRAITGGDGASASYGPAGDYSQSVFGSIIEARG